MGEDILIILTALIIVGVPVSYIIIRENGYFGVGIHRNICKFTCEATHSKWDVSVNNEVFPGRDYKLNISTTKYKLEVIQSKDWVYDISFFSHDRQNIIDLTDSETSYLKRFAKRSLPKFQRLYLDE